MKKALVLLGTLALVSCASKSRTPSSQGCYLKKHDSKPYYKVYHNDAPLYEHWYDEGYANKLLEKSKNNGKCE